MHCSIAGVVLAETPVGITELSRTAGPADRSESWGVAVGTKEVLVSVRYHHEPTVFHPGTGHSDGQGR